jgi:hypothetical protein
MFGKLKRSGNDVDDGPAAEEIRAAVEHIVLSSPFRRSPQLVAFLRFVVETALGGKTEYIKSYTIGVEALGRGESFDPQVDPIVRVEAARIRRALATYFAREGAGSPITVEIPLGHYAPVFRRRRMHHRSISVLISIFLTQAGRIMQAASRAKIARTSFHVRRQPRRRTSNAELGSHAD